MSKPPYRPAVAGAVDSVSDEEDRRTAPAGKELLASTAQGKVPAERDAADRDRGDEGRAREGRVQAEAD
jgi:hypothetical protein